MSELFYRILHFVGILMTFMAISGIVAVARSGPDARASGRRVFSLLHGVGLLLVLVTGFGLLAKMNLGFPGYVIAKLGVWLLLGGIVAVMLRAPRLALACWWVTLALGGTAGYLVWAKPF